MSNGSILRSCPLNPDQQWQVFLGLGVGIFGRVFYTLHGRILTALSCEDSSNEEKLVDENAARFRPSDSQQRATQHVRDMGVEGGIVYRDESLVVNIATS